MSRKSLQSIILFFLCIASVNAKPSKSSGKAFNSYPQRFAEINMLALSDVENGRYAEAVLEYEKTVKNKPDAYNFLRSEYMGRNLKRIDELSSTIKEQCSLFVKFTAKASKEKTEPEPSSAVKVFKASVSELIDIRNKIKTAGLEIKHIDSSLYVSYLSKSILGIPQEEYSGIMGAVDAYFDSLMQKTKDSICNLNTSIVHQFSAQFSGDNAMETANLEKLDEYADALKANTSILISLHSVYSLLIEENGNTKLDKKTEYISQMNSVSKLCEETHLLWNSIRSLRATKKTLIQKPENPVRALRNGNDRYSESLVKLANSFFNTGKSATDLKKTESLQSLRRLSEKEPFTSAFAESLFSECTKIELKSSESSISYWKECASYYSQCASAFAEASSKNGLELENYIDPKNEIKFPARTKKGIEALLKQITGDLNILKTCNENLEDGYAYRASFLNDVNIINNAAASLEKTRQAFTDMEERAERLTLRAQIASSDVQVFYSSALKNFNNGSNNLAIEEHEKARQSYNKNIAELNCDGDIKNGIYENLSSLKEKIITKEKPLFFSTQRNLKTRARRLYDAGDFENASIVISEAKEKRSVWEKITDVPLDEDTELVRLNDFINTALAIKEGREISPFDSKAPEMMQCLSIANARFLQAEEFIKNGDKKNADECLEKAKNHIQLVKNYYPRNKEAGLLSLKIARIVDPETFDATFPIKVEECAIEIKSKSPVAIQAYSDLLDLYEMNPKYPGLKAQITKAEYTLGLKKDKTAQTDVTKAANLSASALEALGKAGRDDVPLEHARTLANSALAINQDDSTAIRVLDEIARRKGEAPAVTLSRADEDLYNKALSDYQMANYNGALEKINQLLKKEENSRSAKILKLKENIERKKS